MLFFSYCYLCTSYGHSKSTTVRLIACLFDSCTFRNNLYQKIQALFICRMWWHIFSTYCFFSYCYWCTCYDHSNSTTVRLTACLFDSCTFRNNPYQKIQAWFICRMWWHTFSTYCFFHTATGALATVICRCIILLISVFFSFKSLNSCIIQILLFHMIKYSI